MPRLFANVMKAVSVEIREELRAGATWADVHLVGTSQRSGTAEVRIDSSRGFEELAHPHMGKSALPPTTIVAVAKAVGRKVA